MKELPRRLWHIFAGLALSIAGLLSPREIFLPVVITITIAALVVEIVRLRSPRVNRRFTAIFQVLLRQKEAVTLTGSAYFLIAASIVFVLCDKSIAAMAMTFVSVGDPIAGMIGEKWGRLRVDPDRMKISDFAKFPPRLVFRGKKGKSLEGSSACLVACLAAGAILSVITHVSLWVVVAGALSATIVESLFLLVDDNLSVPLVTAGVMTLVNAAMV
jgi:dolichol kinase